MRKPFGLLTDLSLAARGTVLSSDFQETVSIDLEGGDQLGLAAWHGGDTVELEFTEQAVVTALCTLAFVPAESQCQKIEKKFKAYTGKVTVV